ncbi:DNA ligase [Alicyclobacillus tolerans]|uniref:ATP-dependent DNA ligase n=1 Tax=Alicyclobacillus tolerans TaxID=90970 RepID=UPI001F2134EC|nr:DNA ligase [Alicyclobacillus tolerans]MCF8565161.1 DNA ligase [Alicyclobacillus tolerans]
MLFESLKPMLLTSRSEAFDDDSYIFEPKWDGWRVLIHKKGSRIEAYTRTGMRITERFPEIQSTAASISGHSVILDCEGICLRDGRSVFDDFQDRGRLTDPRKIAAAAANHPATFIAFDVLYANRVRTHEPLADRKRRLLELVQSSSVIAPTMYVEGAGVHLKKLTEQRNWEGIVAKRKASTYQFNTRSYDWIKIKNWNHIDTVILGYRTDPHFALIVGLHFRTVENKPVAVVEHGYTPDEKSAFLAVVKQLHTIKDREAQWIEPRLCCRIRYLERTERHQLRMATFEEFLFDKRPEDCRWVG